MGQAYSFTSSSVQARLQRMLDTLKKPMTTKQLAKVMHLSRSAAFKYLKHLRETGRVRIHYWDGAHTGVASPVYGLGPGEDAPKPPPKPKMVSNAEYWKKFKRNTELYDKHLALRRARYRPIKPDPLLAWIPRRAANDERKAA